MEAWPESDVAPYTRGSIISAAPAASRDAPLDTNALLVIVFLDDITPPFHGLCRIHKAHGLFDRLESQEKGIKFLKQSWKSTCECDSFEWPADWGTRQFLHSTLSG